MKKIILFLFSLALCFGASWLGTSATLPEIGTWYASLRKPFFTPPNWIFGPVWTLLYFLMAVALYNVLNAASAQKAKVLFIFALQLILNVLWSFVFFKWHLLFFAILVIIALLYFILYFIVVSRGISKTASLCFIPYAAWVTFASALTISIRFLNPGA